VLKGRDVIGIANTGEGKTAAFLVPLINKMMKHPDAKSILERIGFNRQRTLMRMYRGPNGHPGEPSMICAISGPELG